MENPDSVWQIGIIALLAGVMIGVLAYRIFGRSTREGEKVQTELDQTRDELSHYKDNVNQHFNKTSELVNDLTQNYVKVYQHLAEGAHSLGDSKTFNNLLEQHPGKVSLTVDGDPHASMPDASDTIEAVEPVQSASVTAEAAAAEPGDETAPVEAANDGAEIAATASSEAPDSPAETAEPALDANALDATDDEENSAVTTDAGSALPEDEEKPETSRTVH